MRDAARGEEGDEGLSIKQDARGFAAQVAGDQDEAESDHKGNE